MRYAVNGAGAARRSRAPRGCAAARRDVAHAARFAQRRSNLLALLRFASGWSPRRRARRDLRRRPMTSRGVDRARAVLAEVGRAEHLREHVPHVGEVEPRAEQREPEHGHARPEVDQVVVGARAGGGGTRRCRLAPRKSSRVARRGRARSPTAAAGRRRRRRAAAGRSRGRTPGTPSGPSQCCRRGAAPLAAAARATAAAGPTDGAPFRPPCCRCATPGAPALRAGARPCAPSCAGSSSPPCRSPCRRTRPSRTRAGSPSAQTPAARGGTPRRGRA